MNAEVGILIDNLLKEYKKGLSSKSSFSLSRDLSQAAVNFAAEFKINNAAGGIARDIDSRFFSVHGKGGTCNK